MRAMASGEGSSGRGRAQRPAFRAVNRGGAGSGAGATAGVALGIAAGRASLLRTPFRIHPRVAALVKQAIRRAGSRAIASRIRPRVAAAPLVAALLATAAAPGVAAASGPAAAAPDRGEAAWAGPPRSQRVVVRQEDWFQRYPLPEGSRPWSIAVGPDSVVWIVLQRSRELASLNPRSRRLVRIPVPSGVRPARLQVAADGSVWLTDNDFGLHGSRFLWRYLPDRNEWRSYELPFAGAAPLVIGGDGAVWTGQFQGNRLARLDPVSGRVQAWNMPLPAEPGSSVWDLDVDRSGRLWTVSPRAGVVLAFDHGRQEFRRYSLPPDVIGPAGLAVAPGGDAVWVTEHGGRVIGRLDLSTGAFTAVLTRTAPAAEGSRATRPNDLEWDRQGQLWAALHTGNALARVDPATGSMREFPLPEPRAWVQWLARGPDGAIWFAAYGRDYVGRVDPDRLTNPVLAVAVERARLAPGATTRVVFFVSAEGTGEAGRPPAAGEAGPGRARQDATRSGKPRWQAFDVPPGWDLEWTATRGDGAEARITVARNAEPGPYDLVLGAVLPDGTALVRTVRVEVAAAAPAGSWWTVAGFAGMLLALSAGWLEVARDLRAARRRRVRPPGPGKGARGT